MRLDKCFMTPEGKEGRPSSISELDTDKTWEQSKQRLLKIIQHVQTIINSMKIEQVQQKTRVIYYKHDVKIMWPRD